MGRSHCVLLQVFPLRQNHNAYNSRVHLSWGDVTVDNHSSPSIVCVHLKRSKCDQFGKGVDVFIGRTYDYICPVVALLTYMAQQGQQEGPFFRFQDGFPLIKAQFVTRFRAALEEAGVSCCHYSGHSFRIGAATAAAKAGIEDSTVQLLGRWTSSAFLTYIRTPKEQLAVISCTLSRSS